MESSRPQNERVLFILRAGGKRSGKRVEVCVCVRARAHVRKCGGRKAETTSSLGPAPPGARPCPRLGIRLWDSEPVTYGKVDSGFKTTGM